MRPTWTYSDIDDFLEETGCLKYGLTIPWRDHDARLRQPQHNAAP
jgi:hypothetical protein